MHCGLPASTSLSSRGVIGVELMPMESSAYTTDNFVVRNSPSVSTQSPRCYALSDDSVLQCHDLDFA